jgi:hypothetical protein
VEPNPAYQGLSLSPATTPLRFLHQLAANLDSSDVG